MFFPQDTNDRFNGEYINAIYAKRICYSCEYRQPCLEWAVKYGERGIWGGTTESERYRMGKHVRTA